MGDAVIVAAARTADRHRPQGHAARRERVRPGQVVGGRGAEALGDPRRRRRRPADGRVAAGRRRHRPLRRDRARPHRGAGRRVQPPLRVGHGARCRARRRIMAGMDDVVIAGGAESLSTSPQRDEARCCRHRRAGAVDVAQPPRDARRAGVRHVDHGRSEHRRQVGTHARGHGRVGVPVAPARDRGDRRGSLAGGDLPDRGDAARRHRQEVRHRRAPAPRHAAWRSSAALKPLHPEIEGFGVTAGNSSGLNDARLRAIVLVDSEYAEAHGLTPLAKILSWASIGCEPARHRARPDLRDPEGARPRGHDGRRRRPRRDQRGVRLGARRRVPAARPRRGDHERQRLRLLARSPGRGHGRPHDRHARCTSCAAAAAASASPACARAAAWARRRCSRSTPR